LKQPPTAANRVAHGSDLAQAVGNIRHGRPQLAKA
jgi:hypothetical protein